MRPTALIVLLLALIACEKDEPKSSSTVTSSNQPCGWVDSSLCDYAGVFIHSWTKEIRINYEFGDSTWQTWSTPRVHFNPDSINCDSMTMYHFFATRFDDYYIWIYEVGDNNRTMIWDTSISLNVNNRCFIKYLE